MAAQSFHSHNQSRNANNNNNDGSTATNCIFAEAQSTSDIRWKWRTLLERERKDERNSKYYANYVGSKGTRKYVQQTELNTCSSSSSATTADEYAMDKKPTHYLKHLVKIGCPKHDLFPILRHTLSLNLSATTICTHKSWKCATHESTDYGILLHTVSFSEVGLEWRRGAYSQKPLEIRHNDTFCSKLQMKRIANTNFNKIFRPGTYGNKPSLRNGSWKDGKVFYVFKGDQLTLSLTDCITVVFELSSSSTIEQCDSNKHAVIDGWRNVVGGVGFYSPPHSPRVIDTVLVLRKSMEFPMQCLQESKIKVYTKSTAAQQSTCTNLGTLQIGSRHLQLDLTLHQERPHTNWTLDAATNHIASNEHLNVSTSIPPPPSAPLTDSQSVTASTSSNINHSNHDIMNLPPSLHEQQTDDLHSNSIQLLENTDLNSLLDMNHDNLAPFGDTQSVFPLDHMMMMTSSMTEQSPLPAFLTDVSALDMKNDDDAVNEQLEEEQENDIKPVTALPYAPIHSSSQSVVSQRYNPMRCYPRQRTEHIHEKHGHLDEQHRSMDNKQFCVTQYIQQPHVPGFNLPAHTPNLPVMSNENQQILTNRISQLESLNIRVMDLNSRLTQERDQLLCKLERMQSTINQQQQQLQQLEQTRMRQYPPPQPLHMNHVNPPHFFHSGHL